MLANKRSLSVHSQSARTLVGFVLAVSLAGCAQGSDGESGPLGSGNFTGIGATGGAAPSGGSGNASDDGYNAGGLGGADPSASSGGAAADGGSAGDPAGSGGAPVSGGGGTNSGGSGGGTNGGAGSGASGGATGGASSGGGASGTGGSTAKGDCCSENSNSKGCKTQSVEQCVCAKDSFCCNFEWDDYCAAEVLLLGCGTCPTPADCCAASAQSMCSSPAVSGCVCETEPSCCISGWSATCVSNVNSLKCGSCASLPTAPTVFINEIHYDNVSADSAEGVEIAGSAGTDLSGYALVFYNGNATYTKQYLTKSLSGTIPNEQNGFGAVWFAVAGIQNGGDPTAPEPDGVALLDKLGKVIQFLSYEGSFKASDGAAAGMTSVDIGKSESGTTPAGQSLQLTGTGNKYSAFAWSAPTSATPGKKNTGQTWQ